MFKEKMSPETFIKEWILGKYLSENSQKILNSYYGNYQNTYKYQLKHYGDRLTDVVNLIKNSDKKLDILDYGAGTGTESLYFSFLGANVFGVDYYEEKLLNVAIERKKILEKEINKSLSIEFECQDLEKMKNHKKKYDIIWLNEAFHHIEPREDFLDLLPKLLKKGGKVIISEPNAYNLINQLFFFKVRGFKTIGKMKGKNGEEIIFGNERIIFPIKLRKILKSKGIICEKERYFRIFPFNKLDNKILLFFEKILTKLNFLNIHYVYVGQIKK